jgi:integrase
VGGSFALRRSPCSATTLAQNASVRVQAFRRIVAQLDLPAIPLHSLRHSHASLWLAEGVDLAVVADRLGHASASFTLSTYTHSQPGRQAAAARSIARRVRVSSPGTRLTLWPR